MISVPTIPVRRRTRLTTSRTRTTICETSYSTSEERATTNVYGKHRGYGDIPEFGKTPESHLESLKQAVKTAETELWVPATIYRELADHGDAGPTVNPYLDESTEEGWVRVATPLPGVRSDTFDSVADPVEKARHPADEFLNQESKYPVTNNWRDASLVALAVRLFERNARICVITHTADESLAKAYTRIPPEFGYYEIESRYYNPPQTAKHEFPTIDSLTWDG